MSGSRPDHIGVLIQHNVPVDVINYYRTEYLRRQARQDQLDQYRNSVELQNVQRLDAKVEDLEGKLAVSEFNRRTQSETIAGLRREMERRKVEVEKLKEEGKRPSEQVEKLEDQVQKLKAKVMGLEGNLALSEFNRMSECQMISGLRKAVERTKAALKYAEAEGVRRSKDVKRLEAREKDLEGKLALSEAGQKSNDDIVSGIKREVEKKKIELEYARAEGLRRSENVQRLEVREKDLESKLALSEAGQKAQNDTISALKQEAEKRKIELEEAKALGVRQSEEISSLRLAKDEAEHKTLQLSETIKKLQAEATTKERAFQQSKVNTERQHKKEYGQLASNLEATTTKAEKATTELRKYKQDTQKALTKTRSKLTHKTDELEKKDRELSIAHAALTTSSSELSIIQESLTQAREDHTHCSETIAGLQTALAESKALYNATRTNARMEEDRVQKGIEKGAKELRERNRELVRENREGEVKCRRLEGKISEFWGLREDMLRILER
ncbi:hypothetical protein NHQ30_000056 [Ciborinia camelliae]|nr:hypothetical protein NHQ30_000056 [Ciborinia camelliae]